MAPRNSRIIKTTQDPTPAVTVPDVAPVTTPVVAPVAEPVATPVAEQVATPVAVPDVTPTETTVTPSAPACTPDVAAPTTKRVKKAAKPKPDSHRTQITHVLGISFPPVRCKNVVVAANCVRPRQETNVAISALMTNMVRSIVQVASQCSTVQGKIVHSEHLTEASHATDVYFPLYSKCPVWTQFTPTTENLKFDKYVNDIILEYKKQADPKRRYSKEFKQKVALLVEQSIVLLCRTASVQVQEKDTVKSTIQSKHLMCAIKTILEFAGLADTITPQITRVLEAYAQHKKGESAKRKALKAEKAAAVAAAAVVPATPVESA